MPGFVKLPLMWSYQHDNFTVHQLPALSDNYIYLIEAHNSEALVAVDPAEAVSVRRFCKKKEKTLTHIINTHHHWDHTDGNSALKHTFGCSVIGAEADADRIPAIDIAVSELSPPAIPGLSIRVLEVPGHTSGHIAYLIDDALFCGDVLFGGGCGRIFEGTPAQMWGSLCRLAQLDAETKVYCAHEYTLANLAFARTIDADDEAVIRRIKRDSSVREAGKPTIPSSIKLELETNPFLWTLDSDFCRRYAGQRSEAMDGLAVFTDIRQRKDRY